jgi:hypothetical protein
MKLALEQAVASLQRRMILRGLDRAKGNKGKPLGESFGSIASSYSQY